MSGSPSTPFEDKELPKLVDEYSKFKLNEKYKEKPSRNDTLEPSSSDATNVGVMSGSPSSPFDDEKLPSLLEEHQKKKLRTSLQTKKTKIGLAKDNINPLETEKQDTTKEPVNLPKSGYGPKMDDRPKMSFIERLIYPQARSSSSERVISQLKVKNGSYPENITASQYNESSGPVPRSETTLSVDSKDFVNILKLFLDSLLQDPTLKLSNYRPKWKAIRPLLIMPDGIDNEETIIPRSNSKKKIVTDSSLKKYFLLPNVKMSRNDPIERDESDRKELTTISPIVQLSPPLPNDEVPEQTISPRSSASENSFFKMFPWLKVINDDDQMESYINPRSNAFPKDGPGIVRVPFYSSGFVPDTLNGDAMLKPTAEPSKTTEVQQLDVNRDGDLTNILSSLLKKKNVTSLPETVTTVAPVIDITISSEEEQKNKEEAKAILPNLLKNINESLQEQPADIHKLFGILGKHMNKSQPAQNASEHIPPQVMKMEAAQDNVSSPLPSVHTKESTINILPVPQATTAIILPVPKTTTAISLQPELTTTSISPEPTETTKMVDILHGPLPVTTSQPDDVTTEPSSENEVDGSETADDTDLTENYKDYEDETEPPPTNLEKQLRKIPGFGELLLNLPMDIDFDFQDVSDDEDEFPKTMAADSPEDADDEEIVPNKFENLDSKQEEPDTEDTGDEEHEDIGEDTDEHDFLTALWMLLTTNHLYEDDVHTLFGYPTPRCGFNCMKPLKRIYESLFKPVPMSSPELDADTATESNIVNATLHPVSLLNQPTPEKVNAKQKARTKSGGTKLPPKLINFHSLRSENEHQLPKGDSVKLPSTLTSMFDDSDSTLKDGRQHNKDVCNKSIVLDASTSDLWYITSPDYPKGYAENVNCEVTVRNGNISTIVILQCPDFDIAPKRDNSCKDVFSLNRVENMLCGQDLSPERFETLVIGGILHQRTSVSLINFHSKEPSMTRGFQCQIKVVNNLPGCGNIYELTEQNPTAAFRSLNLATFKHSIIDCHNIIKVPVGYTISLDCTTFSAFSFPNCERSFVLFRSGSVHKLCGHGKGFVKKVVEVYNGEIEVYFHNNFYPDIRNSPIKCKDEYYYDCTLTLIDDRQECNSEIMFAGTYNNEKTIVVDGSKGPLKFCELIIEKAVAETAVIMTCPKFNLGKRTQNGDCSGHELQIANKKFCDFDLSQNVTRKLVMAPVRGGPFASFTPGLHEKDTTLGFQCTVRAVKYLPGCGNVIDINSIPMRSVRSLPISEFQNSLINCKSFVEKLSEGEILMITCPVFNIPESKDCRSMALIVNRERYCGPKRPINVKIQPSEGRATISFVVMELKEEILSQITPTMEYFYECEVTRKNQGQHDSEGEGNLFHVHKKR